MQRYKLLKNYQTPFNTIYSGDIKTDEEWAKILNCHIDAIEEYDNWFEEVPVIDIEKMVDNIFDNFKGDFEDPSQASQFARQAIKHTLEDLRNAIIGSPELDSDYYMEQNFFECAELGEEVYKTIKGTHIDCKNHMVKLIDNILK